MQHTHETLPIPQDPQRRRQLKTWQATLLQYALQWIMVTTIYYVSARLGLMIKPVHGFATLVWAPSGMALAMVLLLGYHVGPALFVAASLVNYDIGAPLLAALGIGLGNSSEALLAAYLLREVAKVDHRLSRLRDVLAILLITPLLASPLCASIGVASLRFAGVLDAAATNPTWVAWWLGDAVGAMIAAPPILLWPRRWTGSKQPLRYVEAGGLVVALIVVCRVVFFDPELSSELSHWALRPHMVYPLMLWAGLRFGAFGAAGASVVVSGVAVAATCLGAGPFQGAGTAYALVSAQTFAGIVAATSLIMATVMSQYRTMYQKVSEEQERLRALFAQGNVGIAQTDLNGRLVFVNQRYCDLVGHSQQEVLGLTIQALTHPDDRAACSEIFERSKRLGKDPFVIEKRYVRSDGSFIWVNSSVSLVCHSNGEPRYLLGMVLDISKRRRAEQALCHSEELNQRIINSSTDCIKVLDPDGRILSVNPGGLALLGLKDCSYILHSQWVLFWQDNYQELARQALATARSGGVGRFEGPCPSSHGEQRWWDVVATPLRGSTGASDRLLVVSRDITGMKLAAEAQRESEARFRMLSESLPQIIWTAGPDGVPDYLNLYWSTYTGLGLHYGTGWEQPIHDEDKEDIQQAWLQASSEGEAYAVEFRVRRADGEFRWFAARISPLRNGEGQIVRWIGMASDIHDRKHAEDELKMQAKTAEAASSAKSMFLANMSHEIRTPLGAILGFSELLKQPDLSEEEKLDFIAVIDRNGRELVRLIDDILDLSKVEAGRLEVERKVVVLEKLLGDVMAVQNVKARERAIGLRLHRQGLLPEAIVTDPTRLRQILSNIIGNAIKFTAQGRVDITVSLQRPISAYDEAASLIFFIKDTGKGFSAEHHGKLFQPFAQGDETITRQYGGTGLGLALSRRLARSLEGDVVVVESQPGRGSIFKVSVGIGPLAELELKDLPTNSISAGASDEQKHPRPLEGIRVLVAEDLLDNQILLKRMLMGAGAAVELAHDGSQAMTMALQTPFDAVMMDMQMPVMDGLSATRALRRQGYQRPIIALTAHAMKEERDRCLAAGCDQHLAKPVDLRTLVAALSPYAKL